jgi:hypothetical protein
MQQLARKTHTWMDLSNLQWNMQAHFGEKIIILALFSQASIISV